MQTVKSVSIFSRFSSLPHRFAIFSYFSSKSSSLNHELVNYLIKTVKLSETQALTISNRFSHIKSIQNPQSVYHFLQSLGFSNSHIQSTIRAVPETLFASIDKTLKPKINLFQDLGLVGNDLGKFISKSPRVLFCSVKKRLAPRIDFLKDFLLNDETNNEDLIKVISRCSWIITNYNESRLLSNVEFLESCGIARSEIITLLKLKPRIFVMEESAVINLVSRALDLGVSVDSKMFVRALFVASGLTDETIGNKIEVLKGFGFSECEYMEMFRKSPTILSCSEKKLKLGIDFLFNTVKLEKEVLVRNPVCLACSIEERMFPRYKVLEIVKSKKLLKKQPSFMKVLFLTEEQFLHNFITRFPDDAEELLVAYKGHALDSSSKD